MKVRDLKANPENPRKITSSKLAQLRKAMSEFGDLSGIVFNRRSGNMVAGHQRSKNLDSTAEVVITNSFKKPNSVGTVAEGYIQADDVRWGYREVDWPRHKEMAGTIAANKLAGEWDSTQLKDWMEELGSFDADFDTGLTMFDEEEMVDFGFTEESDKPRIGVTGVDEDDVPDKPVARTKTGYVYLLGKHRLMCGDCTDLKALEVLMGGQKADMVFTDPPYNIAEKTSGMASSAPTNKQNKKLMDADWDKGFVFEDAAPGLEFVAGENCTIYVCCASFTAPNIWKWMDEFLEFSNYCVWAKPNPFPSLSKRRWVQSTELVCYGTRGKYVFNYPRQGNALSVWTFPIGEGGLHPTQKPVAVPTHAIEHSSNEGAIVADLFCGSGTTVIACEKTKRICYAMELSPEYCDIIIERWEKYTGAKAKLLNAPIKTVTRKKTVKQL